MDDLKCKQILSSALYKFVLVRGDDIKTFDGRGIAPLLECAKSGIDYSGYSAADRIVGKAAALLYVKLGVKYVYGEVMSKSAKDVLEANGIACEYGTLAEKIVNRSGDGLCPMEQAVKDIDDPLLSIEAISNRLAELKSGKKF